MGSGGGDSNVEYTQSPEQRKLFKSIMPMVQGLGQYGTERYFGGEPQMGAPSMSGVLTGQQMYDIPNPATAMPTSDWWGSLDHEAIYVGFLNALINLELTKYCVPLKFTSERASLFIDEIDMIHIDGNHSEEKSWLDVELYFDKVKSGGIIVFDDIALPSLHHVRYDCMRAVEAAVEIQFEGAMKLIHCKLMGLNKLCDTTTCIIDKQGAAAH